MDSLSDSVATAAVLIATGSEVATLVEGAELLAAEGIPVRVVNVPSEGLFRDQPRSYQESVLPAGVARYGMTSGLPVNLRGLVGENGVIHGRLVGPLQGARREVRLQRGNRRRRSEEDAREIAETVRVRRQRFSSRRRSDLYIECAGATARRGGFCFADSEIMPIFAVPSVKRGNVERFD